MRVGFYFIALAVGIMAAINVSKTQANPHQRIAYCSMIGDISAAVQQDRKDFKLGWHDYSEVVKKQMEDDSNVDMLLQISLDVYSNYKQSDPVVYVGGTQFEKCMEQGQIPDV